MYKTMGGESWSGFWLTQGENNQSPVDAKDQVRLVLKFIGVFGTCRIQKVLTLHYMSKAERYVKTLSQIFQKEPHNTHSFNIRYFCRRNVMKIKNV
jgi:hypothetical protein